VSGLRIALAAAVLAAAAAGLHAQPNDDRARDKLRAERAQAEKACEGRSGAEHRECMLKQMCAQQKDPKACEERVAKMKDTARSARAACEATKGAQHDECMMKEMCAQAKDAARCEAQGRARLARRERIREACKDKRGDELRACIREQRGEK
jgi:hypothetical protein